jgi:hypothetical protein
LLNEKHNFEPESNDTTSTYSEVVNKTAWLYFGKKDANGGPYMGYWMSENADENLREVLADLLQRCKESVKGGNVIEDGNWIYCTINKKDVDPEWVISALGMMRSGIIEYFVNNDEDDFDYDDEDDD